MRSLIVAVTVAFSAAAAQRSDPVLQKFAAYVDNYGPQVSAVVGTERYTQTIQPVQLHRPKPRVTS